MLNEQENKALVKIAAEYSATLLKFMVGEINYAEYTIRLAQHRETAKSENVRGRFEQIRNLLNDIEIE